MSIFSDYECGAMTDVEYRNACARMNAKERWEEEHYWDTDDDDDDRCEEDEEGEDDEDID